MIAENLDKLREQTTFLPDKTDQAPSPQTNLSPFEREVIKAIIPQAGKISEGNIPYPPLARIHLSSACMHNCAGCLFKVDPKKMNAFMDSGKFSQLFDSLSFLKVKSIDLSGGGEPTLHPEFAKFARMCIKEEFQLSLVTNGIWWDQDIISLLVDEFSFLRVNLDASNDQVYNRIHRPLDPHELQRVLNNLDKIVSEKEKRESDLIIGAKIRLGQTNMNFMEEMVCLVKDMGIDYIQFFTETMGSDSLLPEQQRGVNELMKDLKKRHHPFQVYGEIKDGRIHGGCGLSSVHLIIDPKGDVYSCSHFAQRFEVWSFGNIFTPSVEKLWFGIEHRHIINYLSGNDCPIKTCRWHYYSRLI